MTGPSAPPALAGSAWVWATLPVVSRRPEALVVLELAVLVGDEAPFADQRTRLDVVPPAVTQWSGPSAE